MDNEEKELVGTCPYGPDNHPAGEVGDICTHKCDGCGEECGATLDDWRNLVFGASKDCACTRNERVLREIVDRQRKLEIEHKVGQLRALYQRLHRSNPGVPHSGLDRPVVKQELEILLGLAKSLYDLEEQ